MHRHFSVIFAKLCFMSWTEHSLLKRSPLLSVMIDANIQYLEIFSAQPTQTGLARHFKGHETYTKAKKILVFSKPFSSSVRG